MDSFLQVRTYLASRPELAGLTDAVKEAQAGAGGAPLRFSYALLLRDMAGYTVRGAPSPSAWRSSEARRRRPLAPLPMTRPMTAAADSSVACAPGEPLPPAAPCPAAESTAPGRLSRSSLRLRAALRHKVRGEPSRNLPGAFPVGYAPLSESEGTEPAASSRSRSTIGRSTIGSLSAAAAELTPPPLRSWASGAQHWEKYSFEVGKGGSFPAGKGFGVDVGAILWS